MLDTKFLGEIIAITNSSFFFFFPSLNTELVVELEWNNVSRREAVSDQFSGISIESNGTNLYETVSGAIGTKKLLSPNYAHRGENILKCLSRLYYIRAIASSSSQGSRPIVPAATSLDPRSFRSGEILIFRILHFFIPSPSPSLRFTRYQIYVGGIKLNDKVT